MKKDFDSIKNHFLMAWRIFLCVINVFVRNLQRLKNGSIFHVTSSFAVVFLLLRVVYVHFN